MTLAAREIPGGGFTAVGDVMFLPFSQFVCGIHLLKKYFLLGMAMRLAFDLGLHLDMTSYVRDGTINEAEADLRSVVFWGAYTLDQ